MYTQVYLKRSSPRLVDVLVRILGELRQVPEVLDEVLGELRQVLPDVGAAGVRLLAEHHGGIAAEVPAL